MKWCACTEVWTQEQHAIICNLKGSLDFVLRTNYRNMARAVWLAQSHSDSQKMVIVVPVLKNVHYKGQSYSCETLATISDHQISAPVLSWWNISLNSVNGLMSLIWEMTIQYIQNKVL